MKKYLVILTIGEDFDNCVNKVVGESDDLYRAGDIHCAVYNSLKYCECKHFLQIAIYTEEEVSKNKIKISY